MTGAELYNSVGDLAFSTTHKSLVHLATLSPRNYGGFDTNGYVDFEIPDGVPDDIIPFVSYTGSNPNAVAPVVLGVVNPGHHFTSIFSKSGGAKYMYFQWFIESFGLYGAGNFIGLTRGRSATSTSTLTLSFGSAWTAFGMPATVIVTVPPNSHTLTVANAIAARINTVAGDAAVAAVNYNVASGTTEAYIIIDFRGKSGPVDLINPPAPTLTWSAPPQSGLAGVTSPAFYAYRHAFWEFSNHLIIPAIGDVILYNDVEYTVTGLSGSPNYGASVYSVSDFYGPMTLTTSPPLPAMTQSNYRPYRLKTRKRYVRVATGNVPSENNNHKCYLFGLVQPAPKTGFGMQLYGADGSLTFDSNQRPLVLSAKGTIPGPIKLFDKVAPLSTFTLTSGTVPLNYAINVGYLGNGGTQYGGSPTGSSTQIRNADLHLRRASATQLDICSSNTYEYGSIIFSTTGGAASIVSIGQPFYIIDTSRYPG